MQLVFFSAEASNRRQRSSPGGLVQRRRPQVRKIRTGSLERAHVHRPEVRGDRTRQDFRRPSSQPETDQEQEVRKVVRLGVRPQSPGLRRTRRLDRRFGGRK